MKGLWEDCFCHYCGSFRDLGRHHIFGGSKRKKSEEYGFVVTLCSDCHIWGKDAVHKNWQRNLHLKQMAQKHFEQTHTREEFRQEFGKSYLEDEE